VISFLVGLVSRHRVQHRTLQSPLILRCQAGWPPGGGFVALAVKELIVPHSRSQHNQAGGRATSNPRVAVADCSADGSPFRVGLARLEIP